ncbi:amino acid adenylation domain-containing protein [Streptoalloteichus tenebrarius]|uniref:Amino acid adenylation domain-containing protein n=2 Tax=Streptoalloteichus tenebrarius (strain ATCC 17920 / DSM 40477 / JCM 4838 / CBS 697.72 / NBRC 16177 / NCIMB 11028 / NRRL B-12390 / A12253. 1 / ISP 5477) TaxID=1933 RepID=A0ABT1HPI3_STRSD|nr:amino acid adenylation domain-containing protein [Streptoalloteichus tenebrarius]
MMLHELVVAAARRTPDALAVQDVTDALTYRELDELADRYAAALVHAGVRAGDRVVIWTAKSVATVALMQGCLRVGAIYVPVSAANPPARVERVAAGCAPALRVTDATGMDRLSQDENEHGDENDAEHGDGAARWRELTALAEGAAGLLPPPPHQGSPDDPASVLYTSGSTGEPKGVCLSHANALAFVRWACAELAVEPTDRLANHAEFNFDLSVFDLYAAFHAGASVHLISSEAAYAPEQLVRLIRDRELTIWYSVPSVVALMITRGGLLDGPAPTLRCCVVAGEPVSVEHVRRLRAAWPAVRLFNWYGPTETNVCSSYEIGALDSIPDRVIPIGHAACGDALTLEPTSDGSVGELVVSGPTVMLGYWGEAPQVGPYATGDLVRRNDRGELEYVGRRDHMVKVRGHRVDVAEVESALVELDAVAEAVVVTTGQGLAARLHAVCVVRPGAKAPTLLEVKRRGARRLPPYMLPDAVHVVGELPRTANGKYDRPSLAKRIERGELG